MIRRPTPQPRRMDGPRAHLPRHRLPTAELGFMPATIDQLTSRGTGSSTSRGVPASFRATCVRESRQPMALGQTFCCHLRCEFGELTRDSGRRFPLVRPLRESLRTTKFSPFDWGYLFDLSLAARWMPSAAGGFVAHLKFDR